MTTALSAPPATDALLGVYRRPPMEFVRGSGVELFDADGKAYLDFVAGIAVNALGYGDEGLERAMREAMESGIVHLSNLYRTAPGERLAERLVELTFADRVFFCNSGAEANEGAFKIARRWGGDGPPVVPRSVPSAGRRHLDRRTRHRRTRSGAES
jgi:acetylornithine/succinyldiaminopimelate/putrescine aminotransferase